MGQAKLRREAIARGESDPTPQNKGLKGTGRRDVQVLEAMRHKWFKGGPPKEAKPVLPPPVPKLGRIRDRGREPKPSPTPVPVQATASVETPEAAPVPEKKAARKKDKPTE